MKITFEGKTFNDVIDQMAALLERSGIKISTEPYAHAKTATAQPVHEVTVPAVTVPKAIAPVDKPVDKPVEEPKRVRTEKQLENDARLQARAEANRAAGIKPFTKKKAPASVPEPAPPPPPASAESLGLAPDEVVKLRQKTIEELQAAYANGFQKEVFALLSVHGNGAKSFRELPVEAFIPIREAIDLGALEGEAPK